MGMPSGDPDTMNPDTTAEYFTKKMLDRIPENIRNEKIDGTLREDIRGYIEDVKNAVDYKKIALEVAELVTSKQKQYGDSFGHSDEILRVLYPNGVKPDQFCNFLAITRVIDKLFRIANGDLGGESAWFDINGYSLIALGDKEKKSTLKRIKVE